VFIVTRSPQAEQQLSEDFVYYNLAGRLTGPLITVADLCRTIEEQFAQAKSVLDLLPTNPASAAASVQPESGTIVYKGVTYKDICKLAQRSPQYAHYALALNIRYTYLCLWNQGLARCYQQMNIVPNEAVELFSSAFNNHCVYYCSAFPDLESVFGSLGSFFDQTDDTLPVQRLLLNPPFDSTLITQAIDHIENLLRTSKKHYQVQFTIPAWKDFPAYYRLKSSRFLQSLRYHPKGTLPFIDYMQQSDPITKLIYPCAINEAELSNSMVQPEHVQPHKRKLEKYQEQGNVANHQYNTKLSKK